MEIQQIEGEDKTATFELLGISDIMTYPLLYTLLDDKNVVIATYNLGHPQLDTPILTIQTKRGKPETALKKAVTSLKAEYAAALKLFQKEAKKT